jgi:hypothetical protein
MVLRDPSTYNGGMPDPIDNAPATPEEIQKECDREFGLYESERSQIAKVELASEEKYTAMMVTLSAAAIGGSVAYAKDKLPPNHIWLNINLLLAWAMLGAALLVALYHHKRTYETHKLWRETLDEKFNFWRRGAWSSAVKAFSEIPGINKVDGLKTLCFYLLTGGLVLLAIFVATSLFIGESASGPASLANRLATQSRDRLPDPATSGTPPAPARSLSP